MSFYLHLSKYIDWDHLYYIYLASFTGPARTIPWLSILSSISIIVQACAKDLYETLQLKASVLPMSYAEKVVYVWSVSSVLLGGWKHQVDIVICQKNEEGKFKIAFNDFTNVYRCAPQKLV